MNKRAHRLSVLVAILLVIIGITEPLQNVWSIPVPRFLPPSWQVIYGLLPNGTDWLYTTLWTVAGLVSLAGSRWIGALRLGFRMSALLFLSWGVAGIPAMIMGEGGNIQGSSANLITAILAWLASYGVGVAEESDQMKVGKENLDETIRQAKENGPG